MKLALQAHNSSISVESEVGRGTSFYFALPIADDVPVEKAEPLSGPLKLAPSKGEAEAGGRVAEAKAVTAAALAAASASAPGGKPSTPSSKASVIAQDSSPTLEKMLVRTSLEASTALEKLIQSRMSHLTNGESYSTDGIKMKMPYRFSNNTLQVWFTCMPAHMMHVAALTC